jgi:type VI secretion system protein ImpC
MSLIARLAGAPFVAGGSGEVVGCDDPVARPDPDDWTAPDAEVSQLWQALRSIPEAKYLGVVWPRFLLRLPYGKATDAVERFAFEEQPGHNQLLWGNGALICACLLGQTFERQGWAMRPGTIQDVTDLPLFVREVDGEAMAQPCAEALLGTRALAKIQDAGLMPLASMQGADAVRLMYFGSIAHPPRPLALRTGDE